MQEGRDPIKDMILESGLDADEYADVAEVLATLRSAVPAEAPTPSAELASLLGGVTQLRPRRTSLAVTSGVAAALVLAGGAAAASNNLPEPLQRFAHDVSEKVLPFEFPSPEDRHAQGREGPVPLPEPARNDTDQGKHVGKGDGGGKTGNLGQDEENAPEDEGKPADPPTTPTTPTPPTPTLPSPTTPDRPDKPATGGGDDPGAGSGDAQTDEADSTSKSGSKPTDPGSGGDKGKSGDGSARRG